MIHDEILIPGIQCIIMIRGVQYRPEQILNWVWLGRATLIFVAGRARLIVYLTRLQPSPFM